MRRLTALPLPATDLTVLRERVRATAEQRPAVYRMVDPAGRVIYVGKAARLRTRLLSYFRASFPDDKGARILHAAHRIEWDYVPSEFAACLGELRQIRRHRPHFNHRMNHGRRAVLVRISGGPAPRLTFGMGLPASGERTYGPFSSPGRVAAAVRVLNDLLGLRDCAARMPMVFADQGDLFGEPTGAAACPRHDLGLCSGPCAGLVAEWDYVRRVETAAAFLEGRTIQPIDRAVAAMQDAASTGAYELAARWREKFEALEWLLAATARARVAIDLLSFVYRDPGAFGDDRAYLVRRGTVRASYPWPATPIEREAFRGVVAAELERPEPSTGLLPAESIDEILLLMAWFRAHPEALRRTTPLTEWAAA